ncbi:MAG: hypothetical protein IJ179_00470 [Oscillospiraceae bacterium]|nr:hypothetical protein [Oscillospiraceae bacterium]
MKKVRADKVRGYRIDFSCDTVYLNYSFTSAAEKDFLSSEAIRLREIREAFPSFKVVVKAGRKITTTRSTKRLNYKNMEKYIRSFDNADEVLVEFETIKKQSKTSPSPYKFVRDWFEAKFPNYKNASIFAEKEHNIASASLPPLDAA